MFVQLVTLLGIKAPIIRAYGPSSAWQHCTEINNFWQEQPYPAGTVDSELFAAFPVTLSLLACWHLLVVRHPFFAGI
jgi:hypothetical protein